MLRLHVRCPPGTRIEQSEVYFQRVEDYVRQVIPANELNVIDDNIGLPNNINLARSDSVTAGPSDGEILVEHDLVGGSLVGAAVLLVAHDKTRGKLPFARGKTHEFLVEQLEDLFFALERIRGKVFAP